jgi:hypothetical protein
MSEPMMIRLRCLSKGCGREFDRPDSITENESTFLREKRCPHCECDATTLADVQPRPPVWWSDAFGLIARMPRRAVGDEVRFKILDGEIGNRALSELPLDAVPMAPRPGTDEQRVARQRAADRVAAYLDRREKVDAVDRPAGATGSLVVDGSLGPATLLAADLRLLVQAAPTLPPKWSGLTADPYIYFVQETGNDRTDALIHAREVLNMLGSQGPEADVCRDGLVGLSVRDLETLCDLDGSVVFVGFDRARAEALADGERTTLMWTRVHR